MKIKLALLALLSLNTASASELFLFDQVTAFKLGGEQHSLSGVEKYTGQRIRIEWRQSAYEKPQRLDRCIGTFQQAMNQPERYYLHVELSESTFVGCEIGMKESLLAN
ncbi:conserved exported hypothetical protein [Vibrio chagasii]|jgi:hypothetical protein|uniref:hypothetical protein n=1 Tax=Vibrio TaxID=662 RepID=UPI001493AA2B|nr:MULTISPECIES: hypothetical protein [Vibrio]MCG9560505.1 hypothetical protein [Vibrio chagasii]MCG9569009.1 hypothetical protein [Vibrio chagasii]MCG9673592.1 hypothetical protein [Vibrio chagasii]MDA0154426.1 hypothetical protein [Vibrio sp. Makdt]NOI40119.1 hypothetical protein [Vibrio sp. 070316B]